MNQRDLLKEINQSYKASRSSIAMLLDRRRFNLELYTGYPSQAKSAVQNVDNLRVHVPYTKTLLDNVFPLLTAKLPIAKVSPRDSTKSYIAAKLMDRLINYTFDVNQYEKKYMMTKKSSMLAGDAFDLVIWSPDPEKNYPLIMRLNSDDVSVDPNKLDIDDEWPLYIRREMTKRQMKEMGWNKDKINQLSESKLGNKSYRKQQLRKLGLGDVADENPGEKKDDLYEVVIRWGMMSFGKDDDKEQKMGMVVAANEEAILNTEPVRDDLQPFESPYENNVMPIAHLPFDPLPDSFFSQSFIDPIASYQVELNDLENMKRANYYRRNNPPLVVDKDAEVDLSTLSFLTGLPWLVKGGASHIQMQLLPDLAPSIQNDKQMIKNEMQNVTGASDSLNPTPDIVQKTGKSATHAAIMNENTKMRFRPQAVYEDRYMEKVGKLLINMWQDKNFFNEELALAMSDEEGQNEITIIKNDMIQGDLDFVTTSASSVAQSDMAILSTAVQLKELYAEDQSKDLAEVDKVIIEKAGFDPNKIMKPKLGMLPELVSRLKMLVFVTKQPNFASMAQGQKTRVLNQIEVVSGMIKELQSKIQAQNPEAQPNAGQPQPGQPQPGQAGQPVQPVQPQQQAVQPMGAAQ